MNQQIKNTYAEFVYNLYEIPKCDEITYHSISSLFAIYW